MPANIVKPGQEKYWTQAKARAKEEGHEEDWAYVTAIFKKMVSNKKASVWGEKLERLRARRAPQTPSAQRVASLYLSR